MKKHFTLDIAVAALLLFSGCAVNPVTGKKEVMLVSEGQELAMGQQSDPAVTAQMGLYADPKMQKFIDEKGQKMAAISHRNNLKYQFKVVDSPVINAFAVPGGYVYFTRGIMAHFNNEAQFAGVLGHELGHITARHGQKQQTRSTVAGIGLLLGSIIAPKIMQSVGGVAQQVVGLGMLKYGRNDENESDALGVKVIEKALAAGTKTLLKRRSGPVRSGGSSVRPTGTSRGRCRYRR